MLSAMEIAAKPPASWSALVVEDDPGVRQSIRLCVEADGARALGVATPAGALEALERGTFDVVILDLWLGSESGLDLIPEMIRRQPGVGIVVVTAFATFETAVEAMRLGAVDYLPKPFTPDQVRHAVRRVVNERSLQRKVRELEERLDESDAELVFESQSATYRSFLQTAERAAQADCTVLLRGESGTGKNVLARWIREKSVRRDRPFVSVNCPALSSDLMVSLLFGHRKGSFTGASSDATGKVQEAEGGTMLLDEVGDLVPEVQARLLRFLADKSYERLGEPKEQRADVRILAATNRPLELYAKDGRFREDLLFRLNVVTLTIPSLRDRREDALPLARHYLSFFRARQRRELELSPRAERAIAAYEWPGNLRELRNAVERATILAPSRVLEPQDLGLEDPEPDPGSRRSRPAALSIGEEVSIDDIEREHIARVIAKSPSLEAAARTLGIDATTLQRKRKRYGLA
ncbi:MAG TPA: sigma-54 dependent transcriptional regulator [Labilithrix sp.]|jgi:NtrC-family two-component system response regulator AlgB